MNKPAIHRRFILFVVDSWRVIMDNRYNPLRYIPDPSLQFYFTLVLFTMWSVYFGAVATFYMGWYGYSTITSIVIHLTLIIPIIFTKIVFQAAESAGRSWDTDYIQEQWKKKLFPRKDNVIKWDIDNEA